MADELRCSIELREDSSRTSPGRLVGTLLKYGERAADRPEVFEAGALSWPDNGVISRSPIRRPAAMPQSRSGPACFPACRSKCA